MNREKFSRIAEEVIRVLLEHGGYMYRPDLLREVAYRTGCKENVVSKVITELTTPRLVNGVFIAVLGTVETVRMGTRCYIVCLPNKCGEVLKRELRRWELR